MDFLSLANKLREAAVALGLTSGGALAVLMAVVLYLRTATTFPLLSTLWARFYGKLAAADPTVQAHADELNNLSRFVFLNRLRVSTLKDVHALLAWCRDKNIATAEVKACGSYFDLEAPGLRDGKPPGRRWTILLYLLAVFFGFSAMTSTALSIPDSALMQFRTSQRWFWLSATNASYLMPEGHDRLTADECSKTSQALEQRTGFNTVEVQSLCAFFSKPTTTAYVERNVSLQRDGFGFLAALTLFGASVIWRDLNRAMAARRLSEKIQKRLFAASAAE